MNETLEALLTLDHKLTLEHVHLTSFSKIVVHYTNDFKLVV